MDEFDKILNQQNGFIYIGGDRFDARKHVRLLRITPSNGGRHHFYTLEIVPLEHLRGIEYRALSYVWGHAHTVDDVREIQVDGQRFCVRRNLFDFLDIALGNGENGLFFIDAICINQLDRHERQCQVRHMARIFRCADSTISWLGFPKPGQLDNVRALHEPGCKAKYKDCKAWTASQWAGFRYLSYHRYWTRVWIVPEVLLADRVVLWCGIYQFPLVLFSMTPHTAPRRQIKIAENGRPATVVSSSRRLRSPAELIVTDKLRQVPRPTKDLLQQGTKIGTLEEMTRDLWEPHTVMETYHDLTPDLLHKVVRKFGMLDCSDLRDKLYGFMGILDERSRALVDTDYAGGVNYAYYQALQIGYRELYHEQGPLSFPVRCERLSGEYLGYYCDARDAFEMADKESVVILRQVVNEISSSLHVQTAIADAMVEAQWQQQSGWRNSDAGVFPDFKKLLHDEDEDDQNAQDTDIEAQPLLPRSRSCQSSTTRKLVTIASRWELLRRKLGRNRHVIGHG